MVASSDVTLTNSIIRDNSTASPAVYMTDSTATITGNTITDNDTHGILFANSSPTIIGNTITNNQGCGIYSIGDSHPIIQGNTISGNVDWSMQFNPYSYAEVSGNTITNSKGIYFHSGTLTGDVTWDQDDLYVIHYNGITVAQGVTLTIAPGTRVEFDRYTSYGGLNVHGTLIADGTAEQPITFTSNEDTPQKGSWQGLDFTDTSTGNVLDNVEISYARYSVKVTSADVMLTNSTIRDNSTAYPAIYLTDSTATISGNTITDNDSHGISFSNSSPTIVGNTITNNQGCGIYSIGDSHPIIQGNTISGNVDWSMQFNPYSYAEVSGNTITNSKGIYFHSGTLTGDVTWDQDDLYVIHYNGITVAQGVTLTIAPGTRVEFDRYTSYGGLNVHGTLIADGTAEQPITFTSNEDTPQKGSWQGLDFTDTSTGNVLDNVEISYARYSVKVTSADVMLTNSTIRDNSTAYPAIYLTDSAATISGNVITDNDNSGISMGSCQGVISNNVISNNGDNTSEHGIILSSSSPEIMNNTITANFGSGVYCLSSSPTIINTILWNNSSPQIYLSNSSAIVTYSDIQGGWEGEGNIDEDPLFVDAVNGDFRLGDYSPCIGKGIMAASVPDTDIAGNIRPNPANSRSDIGAYENPLGGFVNPSYDEVNAEIERLARVYDIPPVIIKHIAWKESDWEQYDMVAGDVKTGVDPGGTVGYGIMQVTVDLEDPPPDVDDLKYDWKYNLESGVGKLLEKWYINIGGFTGWDADPAILENWYYAIAWYNGEGEPAYWYIHAVANEPNKSGIYTYLRDPAPQIAQYCTPIEITSPTMIESFSKELSISGTPTGDQIYTLSQIVAADGKIHKWYKDGNLYDEMGFLVVRALCPVDLVITDSSNRLISKLINEIPNATYTEFGSDGDLDDEVVIPESLDGQYGIQIVPEPNASSTETYTLKVWSNSGNLILANNVQIEDIPDQPYSVELDETGIECTPIADAAGPYYCSEGSPTTFDAAGSYDPDGNILQYRWDFDTNGVWDTEWSTEPTASYMWEDDFSGMVTLEVSDGGYTDTDMSGVVVENVAPTVTATNDAPKPEGESIAIAVIQTDPGTSDTFTYSFDWGNDGTYEIMNQSSPSASHTWEDNGPYTVGIMVQDDDGGIGDTTIDVIVTDLAPIAAFTCTPDSQNENSPIQFSDASTSSPDLIASWSWDFGDGNSGNGKEPTHAYADNGTYTVILTVMDDDGSTDDVSHDVTVDNVAPEVEAGPDQIVNEGTESNFNGSFTDPGVDSHTINWNFGDGGSAAGILTPTHTYGDNGLYSVILGVIDDDSGMGSDNLTVTVNNVPPVVQAIDNQSTDEGTEISLDIATFTDAGWLDSHTAVIDWGDGILEAGVVNKSDGQSIVLGNHIYGDNGSYLVRVNVIDDDIEQGTDTFTFTVSNLSPIVEEITVSVDGVAVDAPVIGISSEISATASFSDLGAFDTHTAIWDWGDGTVTTVEDTANPIAESHVYVEAGVYTIKLTVTDGDGGIDSSEFRYIVVYDPSGGFVTGGGWIDSPPGAYVPDPTLIGKANFGFVSKYKKGANTPTGNTEFVFKVAELDFHSAEYEWLVIAGPQAKFKGLGTINNSGNYGFMLSAVDGQVNGGGDVDKFRIKIWDRDDNDKVIYDNQPGEVDDSELTTALGGGSIVIHGEKHNNPQAAPGLLPVGTRLLAAYPNPFNPEVWIPYQLGADSQITIRIYDLMGRLVRILKVGTRPAGFYIDKSKAAYWDGRNEAGEEVSSGIYFYNIQASDFTATRKMVLAK